jgi:hypothetical protein
MLMGKLKREKLDCSMRLFELLNLVMNGLELLVLEDAN